jgi:DNA-binding winged helix-turn-helix (wHTH) protein/tetratricopeptide (TPR) repeat protein
MADADSPGRLNERVELAHVAPLTLGPILVEPGRLRLAHADGREEFLQPRAMQVLVALIRAEGAILTRDDLTRQCWGGQVVGDDAINRVLGLLRRTAEGIGAGIFAVETLPRVGYRLVQLDAAAPTSTLPAPAAAPPPARPRAFPHRLAMLSSLCALGVLALWTLLLALQPAAGRADARRVGTASVALEDRTVGVDAARLADAIATDLSRFAAARAQDLSVLDSARASEADYLIRISGGRQENNLLAEVALLDREKGELLWAATFDRAASEQTDLRHQIAVKLGDVLLCALRRGESGARLDRATLRLYLAFCDRIHDTPDQSVLSLIRRVTEQAPQFAPAWADRALVEAQMLFPMEFIDNSRHETARLRREAQEHLARARALGDRRGETFAAEALLVEGRGRWAERLAILERGIATDPIALLYDLRATELSSVGRSYEAIDSARQAAALDPLSPATRGTLITVLAFDGYIEEARRELEAAERLWPGSQTMREMRFRFDVRYGDPEEALRRLNDPAYAAALDQYWLRSLVPILHARADPTPAKIDAALRATYVPGVPSPIYLQTLASFGRIEEVFAFLNHPRLPDVWKDETSTLFRPAFREVRRDRRFIAFVARLGLVDYWLRTDKWPDFCFDPNLSYDCRAEARRATALRQARRAATVAAR